MRHSAADLVALRRAGGGAVLAFKERIDELSRLSAGRAEDESLLQQLAEKLPALTTSAASRVMDECRLRDEWRQERCEQALRALPSVADDHANIDRMREYVALLAPRGGGAVQPWQRELLRQQQALARVLQLCPGGSTEHVMRALTDFMGHSEARLQQRLSAVEGQLQSQGLRQQPDQPERRAAWGDAGALDATGEAPPPLQPAKGEPDDSWGLTPEAFLEKMRKQHAAVRSLQARARGQQERRRFCRTLERRDLAAVRLQALGRGHASRREAAALRHELWLQACAALSELHSARRLQRAWRWSRRVRRWHRLWQPRAAARASEEDLAWRRRVATLARGTAPEKSGFSEYSVYNESKRLQEERAAKEVAVRTLQACARGAVARAEAASRARAVRTLQAGARGWRARARARWWRRSLRRLHAARRASAAWRAQRDASRALLPAQTHVVLVQLHVAKEVSLLQREATREKSEFEEAFSKWTARLHKHHLAKKLHADWIPQMNMVSGASYFFNLKTGESSEEHPNLRNAQAVEKKQRQQGEAELEKRLSLLREYEEKLQAGQAAQLRQYSSSAAALWADRATSRTGFDAARWVR